MVATELTLYFSIIFLTTIGKEKLTMFGLFKKKSEKEKLQETYAKMMADAHKLSHSNRTAADKLMAEAEEVAKQIDALNKA